MNGNQPPTVLSPILWHSHGSPLNEGNGSQPGADKHGTVQSPTCIISAWQESSIQPSEVRRIQSGALESQSHEGHGKLHQFPNYVSVSIVCIFIIYLCFFQVYSVRVLLKELEYRT